MVHQPRDFYAIRHSDLHPGVQFFLTVAQVGQAVEEEPARWVIVPDYTLTWKLEAKEM